MYLLEFNNHKASRTKNVTYSELVRFFPSPLSFSLSSLLSDSYKAQRMQLPAYIGRVPTSPQPITAQRFALNMQQQHLPLLPHLLQDILCEKSCPKQTDLTEKRPLPSLTVKQCASFHQLPLTSLTVRLITCSLSVLRTLGHFCCDCCCKSKCFEPLLWNIIFGKETQIQLKYHSSDCKLWTGIHVGLASLDMLYHNFFQFLSFIMCILKSNSEICFPILKEKFYGEFSFLDECR